MEIIFPRIFYGVRFLARGSRDSLSWENPGEKFPAWHGIIVFHSDGKLFVKKFPIRRGTVGIYHHRKPFPAIKSFHQKNFQKMLDI
ncbi:MAG TPA: hypothetical protein DGT53_05945 [Dialister sp.]|nr:hypothetical protein [Dialister sp.]